MRANRRAHSPTGRASTPRAESALGWWETRPPAPRRSGRSRSSQRRPVTDSRSMRRSQWSARTSHGRRAPCAARQPGRPTGRRAEWPSQSGRPLPHAGGDGGGTRRDRRNRVRRGWSTTGRPPSHRSSSLGWSRSTSTESSTQLPHGAATRRSIPRSRRRSRPADVGSAARAAHDRRARWLSLQPELSTVGERRTPRCFPSSRAVVVILDHPCAKHQQLRRHVKRRSDRQQSRVCRIRILTLNLPNALVRPPISSERLLRQPNLLAPLADCLAERQTRFS